MSVDLGWAAIVRMRLRWIVWMAVAAVVGLVLGWMPLFGVLGFENALFLASFAAVCSLDLGAAVARTLQRMPAPGVTRAMFPGRALVGTALCAAALPVAVIAVPAVICAVRGSWVPTCDWTFGVIALVAMPVATSALGGMVGFAVGLIVGVRTKASLLPHRSTVLALLVIPVLAAGGLWRFYAAPPVFTYDPLIGYFPGNLYDENVRLGAPLAWARLEQLLWVLGLLSIIATRLDVPSMRVRWAPRPAGRRIGAMVVALALLATASSLHVSGGALGYNVDASDIEDVLEGRIETPHFVIHYARTPEIEHDIGLIAEDHELRYAQVVATLGAAPPGKLESFYFADREQKGRWMGARDVEMAKPWRHEIYLDHRSFPHVSLRHEIAHAVASEFGDPIFGVAARRVLGVPVMFSPGLIEGLAVAVDWPGGDYGRLTPHENVRALEQMGLTPSIRALLSLGFLATSSQRSYQTAGSFVRFLLDTYGAPALRRLYRAGGDFEGAYGKSLGALELEWQAFIHTIALPPDVVEGSRERFRTGSVFARPCPHAVAAGRERAAEAEARGDRKTAIQILREVCRDAPEEPRHLLELADVLAAGSPIQKAEAVTLWTRIASDEDITSSLRAEAFVRIAHTDRARTGELLAQATALPVDPGMRRQLDAETFALHHDGPAGAALRGYFFSEVVVLAPVGWAQLAVLAEPDLGFAHYLLGLQLALGDKPDYRRAAEELDRAIDRSLPGIDFVRNAARKLAVAAYRSGDRERVEHAIAALRGHGMVETDRLLADDWAARLRFDATGRL
jgi:hypothetical protein